ncbi:SDR family oxidoreductase [Nitratireductor sp. XY-223]|uniref:SDR family oxidoreductase n=1 Tax=Nitratireductor sp. XY-223 TaxID=2561926 RepID=UPI00197FCDF5|nr:SDR family oxidoreductase [Nitratireductor sp. XY-223]
MRRTISCISNPHGTEFLQTRAVSGIAFFDKLFDDARDPAPSRRLVTIEDVGNMAVGLVSDAARNATGNTSYVDAGCHVIA